MVSSADGRILAKASDERPGQVEVLMTDGDSVATTFMSPDTALRLTMDLMSAAQEAARRG